MFNNVICSLKQTEKQMGRTGDITENKTQVID